MRADWLARAKDNVLRREVGVADRVRRWLDAQIGGQIDVSVVAKPA